MPAAVSALTINWAVSFYHLVPADDHPPGAVGQNWDEDRVGGLVGMVRVSVGCWDYGLCL